MYEIIRNTEDLLKNEGLMYFILITFEVFIFCSFLYEIRVRKKVLKKKWKESKAKLDEWCKDYWYQPNEYGDYKKLYTDYAENYIKFLSFVRFWGLSDETINFHKGNILLCLNEMKEFVPEKYSKKYKRILLGVMEEIDEATRQEINARK